MNKVYFISFLDFALNTAGKKRIFSIANALINKNVNIEIVSFYNGSFSLNEYKQIKETDKSISRNIIYIFKFIRKFHNSLPENGENCKIYLYPTSYQLFDVIIILYLKIFTKTKIFIDLNEIRKYSYGNIYISKGKISVFIIKTIILFVNWITDFTYRFAEGHIYISTFIQNYYKKQKSIIIPILCLNKFLSVPYLKVFSVYEEFQIGFAGTIDLNKEKMSTFFDGIKRINDMGYKIKINLYGRIANEKYFYSILNEYKIENSFEYHGMIDQDKLINRLNKENHLLVLPRGITKQNIYGFSTKLTDYLEAQLPILTSTVGDTGKYFIDMKNSITYTPDSVDEFTQKMVFIIENYNQISQKLIEGGNDLNNEIFHYSNYSEKLYNFFFNSKL